MFIAPTGDHYVTRLTHTLEVAQIARTISRALNLNEDLTEAIALGHDLGHTPFGHVGESEVDRLHDGGYRHAEQSLRVVERLEKDGRGLNLTDHVRHGIALHSKPKGDFFGDRVPAGLSLEGQVCRLSDAVAYLNHDLADAFRAGLLQDGDLPPEAADVLGSRHSERIHTMVADVVETSWAVSGEEGFDPGWRPVIEMSSPVRDALNTLRDSCSERVYLVEDAGEESAAARRIVALLYRYLDDNRDVIPPEYGSGDRAVVDYLAGMTDHYAISHGRDDRARHFRSPHGKGGHSCMNTDDRIRTRTVQNLLKHIEEHLEQCSATFTASNTRTGRKRWTASGSPYSNR